MSRKLIIITPTMRKDVQAGKVTIKPNTKCVFVAPWMESLMKQGLVHFPAKEMTPREQALYKNRLSIEAWKERQERKQSNEQRTA